MASLSLLILAAAAAAKPAYPAAAVLQELKAVCQTDFREVRKQGYIGTVSETVDYWKQSAQEHEWQEITPASEGLSFRSRIALVRMIALNNVLFASLLPYGVTSVPPMLGGNVYRKQVAGRDIYLSLFGVEQELGTIVGECRIYDPLEDGVRREPIGHGDIAAAFGTKIKKQTGPFGSKRYRWAHKTGEVSKLDVHFGFKGWRMSPFERKTSNFNPYAPYGLTLVAGFHEKTIII